MGTTRVPVGLGLLREWMHLPPTVRVVNVEPGPDFYWFRVVCEGDDVPDAPEANLITTRHEVGDEVLFTQEWHPQSEASS